MVSCRSRLSPISLTGYIRGVPHWLPAAQYTKFNLPTLAFEALNGLASSFIIDLTIPFALSSLRPGLRSSSEFRMVISQHNNKYAERALVVASQLTWNRLPQAVRQSQPLAVFQQQRLHTPLRTCLFVEIVLFWNGKTPKGGIFPLMISYKLSGIIINAHTFTWTCTKAYAHCNNSKSRHCNALKYAYN